MNKKQMIEEIRNLGFLDDKFKEQFYLEVEAIIDNNDFLVSGMKKNKEGYKVIKMVVSAALVKMAKYILPEDMPKVRKNEQNNRKAR